MIRPIEFKRVLVGVEEKDRADHALEAGARLARRFDSRLELVHAVPVPPAMWIGIDREELSELHSSALAHRAEEVRARLHGLEERLELEKDELASRLKVYPGHPGSVLLERIEKTACDLLVLGSHEKRGIFDFGSTARSVLQRLNCGLWVQPGPWKEVRRILVPVDLSQNSLDALEVAREVAQRLEAELLIVHCFEPPEMGYSSEGTWMVGWSNYTVDHLRKRAREELDAALAKIDWKGVAHTHEMREGSPNGVILDAQKEVQLIVMGTHGRSGLSSHLLGNVTYSVLRDAQLPVLAVKNPGLPA